MYTLLCKIYSGNTVIGYTVTDGKSNYNLSKKDIISLAYDGKLSNAVIKNGSLHGINGTDLRKLKSFSQSRPQEQSKKESNHRLAERYTLKWKISGVPGGVYFELLPNDKVAIQSVSPLCTSKKFVIPSFVSSVKKGAFQGCTFSEIYIDNIGDFDCSNLCRYMRSETLKISMRNPMLCTGVAGLFKQCSNLISVDISDIDTSRASSFEEMFYGCTSLKTVDLHGLNTSNVRNMTKMFDGCKNLVNLDISSFDTSKVTSMAMMFSDCRELEDINLSRFDTSKVKYMNMMFSGCHSVSKLDLRSFDTKQVIDMNGMFNECSSLTELNLRNFNTENVTDMGAMFYNCTKLLHVDISSFDTSHVESIWGMFSHCKSLLKLDLGNFTTERVEKADNMFAGCLSLKALNMLKFSIDTSKVRIDSMFYRCNIDKLVAPKCIVDTYNKKEKQL